MCIYVNWGSDIFFFKVHGEVSPQIKNRSGRLAAAAWWFLCDDFHSPSAFVLTALGKYTYIPQRYQYSLSVYKSMSSAHFWSGATTTREQVHHSPKETLCPFIGKPHSHPQPQATTDLRCLYRFIFPRDFMHTGHTIYSICPWLLSFSVMFLSSMYIATCINNSSLLTAE